MDLSAVCLHQSRMKLLMPCGIGLAPTKVEVDATDPEKLTVSLEQTEAMLLEDASEATALEVHRHPALAALAIHEVPATGRVSNLLVVLLSNRSRAFAQLRGDL